PARRAGVFHPRQPSYTNSRRRDERDEGRRARPRRLLLAPRVRVRPFLRVARDGPRVRRDGGELVVALRDARLFERGTPGRDSATALPIRAWEILARRTAASLRRDIPRGMVGREHSARSARRPRREARGRLLRRARQLLLPEGRRQALQSQDACAHGPYNQNRTRPA